MSDVKQVLSVMNEDARRGPLARPLLIARTVAIITAVIGATPTAYQFYQSWKHDIPYSEVPHRLSQYELFVANIDCNPSYKALTAANGTRIDAAACPKTGDISVRIVAPGNQAYHQWVAFKQLQKTATARSAWLDLFVASAHAQEGKPAPAAVQTAQAPTGAPAPAGARRSSASRCSQRPWWCVSSARPASATARSSRPSTARPRSVTKFPATPNARRPARGDALTAATAHRRAPRRRLKRNCGRPGASTPGGPRPQSDIDRRSSRSFASVRPHRPVRSARP